MADPTSIAPTPARLSLGESGPAYEAAVDRARAEEWVTRLFDHDTTLWSSDERVQAAIADRLGWLEAPVHFANNTAGLEGFGDAVVAEGFTDVGRGRDGRQHPRARCPEPDVRKRGGIPDPAHPRLDRSGLRLGDARRPRRAPDDDGRRDASRARPSSRTPSSRRPGSGPRQPSMRSITTPTRARAGSSSRSPIPARAPTRSPITTTSARSSSTRPTSAGAIRR